MRRLVLFALFMALVACSRRAADPASLLPGSAAGWSRQGESRTFAASDLWRYMDGGADRYVEAGVQQTATADYRRGNIEAVVDLHRFTSPEAARKIMDADAAGGQPISLGDAGRSFGQGLLFRRGPYLVRVIAFENTADVGPAVLELARNINEKL